MALQSQPGKKKSEVTISSTAGETDALLVHAGGTLSLSVVGTYDGTVQLQRSFDGVNFVGVEDYAGTGSAVNTQKDIIAAVSVFYKIAAPAWTSGSAATTLYSSS